MFSPGDLPNPGIEPTSLLHWQAGSFPLVAPGNALHDYPRKLPGFLDTLINSNLQEAWKEIYTRIYWDSCCSGGQWEQVAGALAHAHVFPGAALQQRVPGFKSWPVSYSPLSDFTFLFLRGKGPQVYYSETSSCWMGATDPSLSYRCRSPSLTSKKW